MIAMQSINLQKLPGLPEALPTIRRICPYLLGFVGLSLLPFFIGALIAPLLVYRLYRPASESQQDICAMPYTPSQVFICFPFVTLSLLWFVVLSYLDKTNSISGILAPCLVLFLFTIWPVFWKKKLFKHQDSISRLMPFQVNYVIASALGGIFWLFSVIGYIKGLFT